MLRDGRGKRSLQGKSDVWKGPKPSPVPSQNAMQQQEASGPPSRTRARIKRKLQGVTLDFVSSKIKQVGRYCRWDLFCFICVSFFFLLRFYILIF